MLDTVETSNNFDNLYQDFFRIYSANESKEDAKKFFLEKCQDFKRLNSSINPERGTGIVPLLISDDKFKVFFINIFNLLYKTFEEKNTADEELQVYESYREESLGMQKAKNLIIELGLERATKSPSRKYNEEKRQLASMVSEAKRLNMVDIDETSLGVDAKLHIEKSQIPAFIQLLKNCSDYETSKHDEVPSNQLTIIGLLQYPSLFENLDCFEIKKIVDICQIKEPIYIQNRNERIDYINKNLKLATYHAVKNSKSFELIDPSLALSESDFDSEKLTDLKQQLGITENLDSDGLMRLFFTLKYFGEENNFILAIRPEKIRPEILQNYNLNLDDQDLKSLHLLRTPYNTKSYRELLENFFVKLDDGKKHFCTSFNISQSAKIPGGGEVGFVTDQDVVPVIHAMNDFYSENYIFPKFRSFDGSDQPNLREFVESRNYLTYTAMYCATIPPMICPIICSPKDAGIPLLIRITSNLNPRLIYKKMMEEYLFDRHLIRNPPPKFINTSYPESDSLSSDQLHYHGSKGYLRSGSDSIVNRIVNKGVQWSESNIYLNLSDIDGISIPSTIDESHGSAINKTKLREIVFNSIDCYTETCLRRKETLDDPEKFEQEISKIQWQREKFCNDVKKSLVEKLKELKKDLDILKDTSSEEGSSPKSKILLKHSRAYLDCNPLTYLCLGQDREFYDEHDQQISLSERLKLINPENISIYLQSLIDNTNSDIEYLDKLSKMPDRDEIKNKLKRNLNIYDSVSCQKVTLTQVITAQEADTDLIKLFLSEKENPRISEKFKFFVQKLSSENFFEEGNQPETEKNLSKIKFFKEQIKFIADQLGINLDEQIAIGKTMEEYTPPQITTKNTRTILPREIPPQLSMDYCSQSPSTPFAEAKFMDSKYQLNQEEIKDLLSTYKIQYSQNSQSKSIKSVVRQSYYNSSFGLDGVRNVEDFTLENAINNAFQNLGGKITEYQYSCKREKSSQDIGRDIHDGHHALTTSYYAKELLKRYQEKKHLFSQEMQAQIDEFNDPQKVKDLEILSIMHDVARTHDGHDQDEYKNAFYVALKLRKMGDPRFQGDEISQEGLQMITDLANKESKDAEKSLMSKLIQSADSLAILRCEEFKKGQKKYSFEMNECYQDFAKIENQDEKNKELARLKVIGYLLQENEKKFAPPKFLEFSTNPFEEFSKDKKIQDASEIFKFEITHDQKGFTALLKAGCFEYIKSNFKKEEIEVFYRGSQSLVEKGSAFLTCQPQDFDSYVASRTDSSSEQSTTSPTSATATVVMSSQTSTLAPTNTNTMT